MDEIHHFHETFLHPALVKCGHNLNEIGRVFLEYSDNFEIYSIYCRNSKKSEELRRILGRNAFLQSGIHAPQCPARTERYLKRTRVANHVLKLKPLKLLFSGQPLVNSQLYPLKFRNPGPDHTEKIR